MNDSAEYKAVDPINDHIRKNAERRQSEEAVREAGIKEVKRLIQNNPKLRGRFEVE